MNNLIIDTKKFHYVVNKLRTFCINRGFLECHTQNRLSILAACEDPTTIATFNYADSKYPLPQTGQMWLEYELMKNPDVPGYFCVSTSYRQEPNPVPGRHDLVFPMFEFELKGDINDLKQFEEDLVKYLGYGEVFPMGNYTDVANKYGVYELEHQHEQKLYEDYGSVYFLMNFPEHTSPFWNMKRDTTNHTANKIDVILSGMETIGSAERSSDVEEMKNRFFGISNGLYANTLYNHFGKDRVDKELDDFFNLKFITRSGGGIGITRLISSMEKEGLLFK